MKKIIFFLLVPFLGYSQEQNDSGYFKVFQTNKTNSEVYQKTKEWTAITFKSAQDVIQLDTEEKIILKGNLPYTSFSYVNNKISPTSFKGEFMMSVAIREGRYKVDVEFEGSTWAEGNYQKKQSWEGKSYLWQETSKDELLESTLVNFDKIADLYKMGKRFRTKERQNLIDNFDNTFSAYLMTKESLKKNIESLFESISIYINKDETEEDW